MAEDERKEIEELEEFGADELTAKIKTFDKEILRGDVKSFDG